MQELNFGVYNIDKPCSYRDDKARHHRPVIIHTLDTLKCHSRTRYYEVFPFPKRFNHATASF